MTLTEKAIARVFQRWARAYPAWAEGAAPFGSDRWIWAAGECERAADLAERIWLRRERTRLRCRVAELEAASAEARDAGVADMAAAMEAHMRMEAGRCAERSRRLRVEGNEDDARWWDERLEAYEAAGAMVPLARRRVALDDMVRESEALGLYEREREGLL